MTLDTIITIGSILGFSFIYVIIKDIIKFFKTPKLRILRFNRNNDLRNFTFPNQPYLRRFANLHVRNVHNNTASRCVATMDFLNIPTDVQIRERQYTLHWADVPYSTRTTESQPVDVGPEIRRLDVVFTDSTSSVNGCLVSMPLALTNPNICPQAILPPGQYTVLIRVRCDNGKPTKGIFRIISPTISSPTDWRNLNFVELRGIRPYFNYLKEKIMRRI